ncbi:MAG: cation transporter [Corynebacteriales bacterium]|nr:cation transporter [Mycobacteriales bacterium]
MGADHSHGINAASVGSRHRRPLFIAFALTVAYMVAEIIGGLITNSLALLSDAAHMGTDALGLGMALAAVLLAGRKGPPHRTFGLYRLEVLAALANALLLFGVAGYVLYEAYERWSDPPEVEALPMAFVALGGLVVNIISFRLLMAGAKESINVKGAYMEVLGDLLGSIGVLVGAIIIATTGWGYADPLIAGAIGLLILPRTFSLARQAIRILMEAAPKGIDVVDIKKQIQALPGVVDTHDLHVWTITSGLDAVAGHVVVADAASPTAVLSATQQLLREKYHLEHITIQTETLDQNSHAGSCQ